MKTTYIQPHTKVRQFVTENPLAGVSGQLGGNTIIEGGDEGGDPGGALAKPNNLWEDDDEEENN